MVVMSKELPSPAMSKELPSPAATVLKGRKGRAVFTKADQVAANSSDEDWDSLDDDSEDEDGRVSNVGRGRVRLHAVQQQISSAFDAEDDRRKCLAEKGWARKHKERGIMAGKEKTEKNSALPDRQP